MARKSDAPKTDEALGISDDYEVARFSRQGDVDVAHLRREARERTCPRCGARAHVKGHRWRKVWHAPAHRAPLMHMIEAARMICPKRKKTWNEHHEMIGSASIHMSVDVQDLILADLMDKKSVRSTSERNRPSPYMASKVLDRAILDFCYLPATPCIDEFKANSDKGKMAVAIANGDTGFLVEILPQLTTKCIGRFFEGFSPKERASVRYFCSDMSAMFIRAQKTWFPGATLRIDFERAEKLSVNRTTLMSALDLTEEEIAELAFLKPREARVAKVERLLGADPDLACAYRLMHLFRDWSDMKWCAEKRDSLSRWIGLAVKSGIPEMKRAAKTLRRNREGVLNGYKFNKTNATAEGLNNSIKATLRMSYGFKTFERMRRRCLSSLGYMRVIKRGVKINGVRLEHPSL